MSDNYERLKGEELIAAMMERIEYVAQVVDEAYHTQDGEDEHSTLDPIHAYADHLRKEAVPLSVMALALMVWSGRWASIPRPAASEAAALPD